MENEKKYKIQVRRYKEIKKPCPICGAIMGYDILITRKKNSYQISYDCPNGCENIPFEEKFEYITTEEQMIWYEEEEI